MPIAPCRAPGPNLTTASCLRSILFHSRSTTLFAALLCLLQVACVPPQSVRIDHETDDHRHCLDYRVPTDWQFPEHGPVIEYQRDVVLGYTLRRLNSVVHIRGLRHREGSAPEQSNDIFGLHDDGTVTISTEHDWDIATAVMPYRKEQPDFPSKATTPTDPYSSPREFARGPKLLCPNGSRLLRIHYEHGYGPFTPSTTASLEVFDLKSGKRLWAATGPAPQVPPVDLFATISWLDDSTILWPRNQIGTHLTICWQVPD